MKTFLDWSAYRDAGLGDAYADIPRTGGDFAKAVAVCINARQCEQAPRGVMCPSYRVTDDETLSTGGRVRRLKAALNGELGLRPFLDHALGDAMELCVSCKGCKRECENGVDMAQIKIEFLAQRNAALGVPLRSRLFGHLPRWLHRHRRLRALPALRNRWPLLAHLGHALLGITAGRRLPEPAATPFAGSGSLDSDSGEAQAVVLFVDTFSRHFEPEIAQAAQTVLEAGGYRVIVAEPEDGTPEPSRPLCCGRTYLAHGMLEPAREEARRVLAVLEPHARAGRPIIGLEPPCLLALRDDYRSLGLGEAAEVVSGRAILFEEFLAREQAAKRLQLPLKPQAEDAPPLLVHGHCHQKAVGAMKSMRKVLKRMPGLKFELVEASCCGMAGSFGLEAEHAAISRRMAEQALLPTLRAAPQARVVANGFSCREQIREGSEHRPTHLALLLREALA